VRHRMSAGAVFALLSSLGIMVAAPVCGAEIDSGQGIVGVKLRQTGKQVEKRLGEVHFCEISPQGTCVANGDWQYAIINGNVPPVSDAFFTSRGRVESVSTGNCRGCTSTNVGVGASQARLQRTYPSIDCHLLPSVPKKLHLEDCKLPAKPHQPITVFQVTRGRMNQVSIYTAADAPALAKTSALCERSPLWIVRATSYCMTGSPCISGMLRRSGRRRRMLLVLRGFEVLGAGVVGV
jgi:hypothetical protein